MSVRSVLRRIHDSSPIFVQTAIRGLFAALPNSVRLGKEFESLKKQFLENDRRPLSELLQEQKDALQRLAQHAYEHSSFHRRSFDEAGLRPEQVRSPEDLRPLRPMTRQDVLERFEEIRADDYKRFRPEQLSSGGSTGEPVRFLSDKHALIAEKATMARHWQRAGYRSGEPYATLRGLRLTVSPKLPWLRTGSELLISGYHLTPSTLGPVLDAMRKHGTTLLNAYPSSGSYIARLIEEAGLQAPVLRAVITASESLYPDQRSAIERVFRCKVYDHYGLTELAGNASQCELAEGYHWSLEMGIVEVLDEQGNPCGPGREGELVLTGLRNYSFPFIRYRTGDRGVLAAAPCACGRPHPLIERITGRITEYLRAPSGAELTAVMLNVHDHTWQNVRQFQYAQVSPSRVVIRVIPSSSFSQGDSTRIAGMLRHKLQEFEVVVEPVQELYRTPRGKTPVIVREFER